MRTLRITILLCLLLSSNTVWATTYQAVANGLFTDNATWAGTPPDSIAIAGDTIIIPNGVTVWMDTDLRVASNTVNLHIDGSLIDTVIGAIVYKMEITPCLFTGSGLLKQRRLIISGGASIDFEGKIIADRLDCLGLIQYRNNTRIEIKDYLYLTDSSYNFSAGTLTLDSNSTILITEGVFDVPANNNAVFDFSRPHTVTYANIFSFTTGEELKHGILHKDIELNTYNTVHLSEDLHIHKDFYGIRGALDMNGHDITIEPTGDIKFMLTYSWIKTSKKGVSSFIVKSSKSITDPVKFKDLEAELKNFVVDMGSKNAVVTLGGPVVIYDTLSLQLGKVYLDIHDIYLSTFTGKGVIEGGSESSYLITKDTIIGGFTHLGALSILLYQGQSAFYPIGTYNYYAPARITNNTSEPEWMPVVAIEGVRQNANYGYNMALSQPMVNISWATDFSLTNAEPDSMLIELMWKQANEVNSFNRNNSYSSITYKGSNNWSKEQATQANVLVNGFYSIKRGLITPKVGHDAHLYLGIFDNKTNTSINQLNAQHKIYTYPNPAKDVLHIEGITDVTIARIYNTTGQIISEPKLLKNSINTAMLPTGTYFLMLINNNTYIHTQFVKH